MGGRGNTGGRSSSPKYTRDQLEIVKGLGSRRNEWHITNTVDHRYVRNQFGGMASFPRKKDAQEWVDLYIAGDIDMKRSYGWGESDYGLSWVMRRR